jgi:hypothetical protein
MAISKLAWTGSAKESTPGTLVQPPTLYIPTKAVFKGGKKREYLNEERGTRDKDYGVVDSVRQSSIEMKGPYYNDVSPVMLWAMLGLPTDTTPNPATYKHTFPLPLVNIPPSYSISRNLDARAYTIPYSVIEKWTLHYTVDGKLLEMDSSWLGMFAQIYASPPVPTFSTVLPMAGYAPVIKFSDGVASTDVSDLQIEMSQKITLWYGGNQNPDFLTVYFGERSVVADVTARFDNDTLYQRWRLNNMDSLSFDVQGALINNFTVSLGSPTAGNFTLTFNSQTTAPITFNATAATVQSALALLTSVPAGSMIVTGPTGGPYGVQFTSVLTNSALALTGSGTGLTGGTFAVAPGVGNHELNMALANLTWDTMEHDLSKDNVLIKAKGTAISPASGPGLITGYVVNNVANYLT